jgi:hypothetical protein
MSMADVKERIIPFRSEPSAAPPRKAKVQFARTTAMRGSGSLLLAILVVVCCCLAEGFVARKQVVTDSDFAPGSFLLMWAKDEKNNSVSVFVSEYFLASGRNHSSTPIPHATVAVTYLDYRSSLFFAIVEPLPSYKQHLALYDISSETPTLSSICELPFSPNTNIGCLVYADLMVWMVIEGDLYLVDQFNCHVRKVLSGLPPPYDTETCALHGTTLVYLSEVPFSECVVYVELPLRRFSTVPYPPNIYGNVIESGLPMINSLNGDLYISFSFNTPNSSLWYLPHAGTKDDWVNLCKVGDPKNGTCHLPKLSDVVGMDPRYTAATFHNTCYDHSTPVPQSPKLKNSPILIGKTGLLQPFAYSAYLNCVVWVGPPVSVSFGGGFGSVFYDPFGDL